MTTVAAAEFVKGPYALILLEVLIIGLQCLLAAFPIGALRRKYFTKAFYDQHFPELKGTAAPGGYPDMGNGRYSDKLTLVQWTAFNNAQRAHQNYVEGITVAVTTLLVAGLFQPTLTAGFGAVYIVGRALFALGYVKSGAQGRFVGIILVDIALVGALAVGMYGAFSAAGGIAGIVDVAKNIATLNL